MSLYENWIRTAYDREGHSEKKFWETYMPLEQKIYERILSEKTENISCRISDFAEANGLKPEYACGFFDGIKGALTEPLDTETLEEDSEINVTIDFEMLFRKMVEFKAKHLYSLPQWDNIFTEERRKELFEEQKKSGTFVRGEKTGRNDPCPCGSGKKYKKCCGAAS